MTLQTLLDDPQLLRVDAFVDGSWSSADDGGRFVVTNPANGLPIAEVPDLAARETRRAIEAADRALRGWRAVTARERADILRQFHALVLRHREDLARIITTEQGKALHEARGEVLYAASYLEWFAEEARRIYGDVIPGADPDRRNLVIRQPVGVVGAITPWNFPLAMLARKCAPGLAAGCTMVIKPAEATPLSALALAEIACRAGVPPGVFNVLTTSSGERVGDELTANPMVRKLSFTGSTAVGKLLLAQCAATVKRVSLELGGNAPFIVFADADVDAAVAGAMAAKFRNSGQTCVCANRFYIHTDVYAEFAAKLVAATRRLRVGDGLQDGVEQGPLINAAALAKIERLVADALDRGAQVACGGEPHELGGTFYKPTVLTEVGAEMALAGEEIFGPVAALFRFSSEDEVIGMANATRAGLAAYFYSRDIGRIWRVAEALDYGMVGINAGIISSALIPFGGVKESGLGREGSRYGIDDYTELKYLCMAGLDS
jgi:succinate-semialdehyde dehydrogenase/glutarate-semialdehyde dehydrogenase